MSYDPQKYQQIQQLACSNDDYDACLRQHCDCYHEAGCPTREEAARRKVIAPDLAFVHSVLPDHYIVMEGKRPGSIRCTSRIGIRQNGDADDEEQWSYTLNAFRQHFGPRFMEIEHNVNFCYTDFTIHLRAL